MTEKIPRKERKIRAENKIQEKYDKIVKICSDVLARKASTIDDLDKCMSTFSKIEEKSSPTESHLVLKAFIKAKYIIEDTGKQIKIRAKVPKDV